MKFRVEKHSSQKNREINLLVPIISDYQLTAGHDSKGYEAIIANSTGYNFLKICLLIAANLQNNELIYIPIHLGKKVYGDDFCDFEYYKGIYLMNYCATQISVKELGKVTSSKSKAQPIISKYPSVESEYIDHWKTDRRLTIKKFKETLVISSNGDGFVNLANGANHFSEWGDHVENNEYSGHRHYDWNENTSKSIGITFNYWQIDMDKS